MATTGIIVDDVWKKFRRGEIHDSIRDFVPAMAKRALGRNPRADELGKKEFWALREVSFEVRAGEALGIIGRNGAGKSTILKILSGIMQPNRGRVSVEGRMRALIEIAAGFHPDLTGRENVFLNGAILGMSGQEVAEKLEQIVDFSGIEPFLDTPVKRYSSGMLARLGFSVAAHMDPEVLLVDEILSVGDLAFQKKCFAHMLSLTTRGVAVIFVSHNLAAISQLCPRTLVLSEGAVQVIDDTPEAERLYLSLLASKQDSADNVTLEEIELTDEHGKPRAVFKSGETCRVRAVVRTCEPFADFALGLSLSAHSGHEVFHTTSHRLHGMTIATGRDERIELEAHLVLNLAGGDYRVFVQCHDYARVPGSTSELCRFDAAHLQIPMIPEYGGVSFLEPRMQLRSRGAGQATPGSAQQSRGTHC